MEILTSYNLIIEASSIIILSFLFGEISRKTNIPAVLLLIILGIGIKLTLDYLHVQYFDFFPILEVLGIVGLIMIVLEAALELELRKDKIVPILMSLFIATSGLLLSTWVAAEILYYFIPMTKISAWIYATPLSILSSAIIIPSVSRLNKYKKEFHIYESTFSDILGIMLFYFLLNLGEGHGETSTGVAVFFGNLGITIGVSIIASYLLMLVFQRIKSNTKLFLLIAVLLILYSLGKKIHLSSLIIILIFGLVIANMKLFFIGKLGKLINIEKAKTIYDELHIITRESAFVVRTFFFVIFGITISLASLLDVNVAIISSLILVSIYLIRFVFLRVFIGSDIFPQVFIAPRGLITILLFYAIPETQQVAGFDMGILLFIIISTSLMMTFAMIFDKKRTSKVLKKAQNKPVEIVKWLPKDPSAFVETKEEERSK